MHCIHVYTLVFLMVAQVNIDLTFTVHHLKECVLIVQNKARRCYLKLHTQFKTITIKPIKQSPEGSVCIQLRKAKQRILGRDPSPLKNATCNVNLMAVKAKTCVHLMCICIEIKKKNCIHMSYQSLLFLNGA